MSSPQMWHAWPSFITTYQQPSPALQQPISFQIVQLVGCPANTVPMLWCRNSNPTMLQFQLYELQFSTLPASQPMNQQRLESYRASSAGPSRDQGKRRGRRKTETLYINHISHVLSAGIRRDPRTGITQPRRMGAINATGTGWARRSPSRVLSSMPERICQPMRRNRCDKDRSSISLGRNRGRFRNDDPSQYEIRIEESEGSLALPTRASLLHVTPPTSTSEVFNMTTETAAPRITEEQQAEEDQDFDGI